MIRTLVLPNCMEDAAAHGEFALDLLRIANHCTNIAEWLEFSVTGIHKDCQ